MGKRRQREAINGKFELPEPIIHRVQSFLTTKEAAQTAILSKSWFSAWSTRPNLDLDLSDFDFDEDNEESDFNEFMEFAEKTILRYEQSNLKIGSFRIRTVCPDNLAHEYRVFVNEMITRALRIGATHIIAEQQDDLFPIVILRNEVFEAENLVELTVHGCKIDNLGLDRQVRCSKLESLCLNTVRIDSAMISNIASCCPMIENLSLVNINSFTYVDHYDYLFLSDLSSKFPSLKYLTLRMCTAREVSSRTLEQLYFGTFRQSGLSVKFDVPNIRMFIFDGDAIIPSLSFVSVSREWESNVSFTHRSHIGLSTLWLFELNKFLTALSSSKIHLSLDIDSDRRFENAVGDIRGLTKPEVEKLKIRVTGLQDKSCFAFFDGLFRICRPKVIIQHLCSEPIIRGQKTKNDLDIKTVVRGLDEKSMFGLQDLEEVNVQLFSEDVYSWRPLTLESLVDALTSAERWASFFDALASPKGKRVIRFQLKWKTQNSCTL